MPSHFDFRSKRVFLTYPRSDGLTRELIRNKLIELGVQYYIVGREQHADGGTHFHAYGEWIATFRTQAKRAFDISGYHPNIQSVRVARNVMRYICKEDTDPLTNMQLPNDKPSFREVYMANTETEFWELARAADPRAFILQHERLEYFARKRFKSEREQHIESRAFSIPTELREWVFLNVQNPQPVSGPTGPQYPCLPSTSNISSHAYIGF